MRYIEITVAVPAAQADAAADALGAIASGVSVERPFTQPDLESGATACAGGTAFVRLYGTGADGDALREAARRTLAWCGIDAAFSQRPAEAEDWAEAWKEHWHAERFGQRIVVVPSWREYAPQPEDVVLRLDPGMAFGTGQHETTRMCLEALERCVRPGARVLDAGCGSGILAIAAAKLGAARVDAVDIDPDCARITDANARENGVAAVRAAQGSVPEDLWPFDEPSAGRYDVVVANIVAGAIIEMARPIVGALATDGWLIVSGIIAARERDVRGALVAAGARIRAVRAMGDWRCIEAVRA